MGKQPTCEERIEEQLKRELTRLRMIEEEGADEDGDGMDEYMQSILEFTPMPNYTVRVLLSTGGPSDEFELNVERTTWGHRIVGADYIFKDWFDGARRTLSGDDLELIQQVFDPYVESIQADQFAEYAED